MPSIKILAIDGGGIRGIIPAVILASLQERLGAELWRSFDLIAGTSTGGIIALGLGTRCSALNGAALGPYSPQQLLQLYIEDGPDIFRKTLLGWALQLFRPKYSPAPLEAALKKYFGPARLASALTPLLISSYDLHSQLPFFFKSHMIAGDSSYDWPLIDVARATSAAPTFFPPRALSTGKEHYNLVDGGVFVNNPAAAAYAEARWIYRDAADFVVLSVGTGDRKDCIRYAKARKWGLLGWAKQIVPVLMDSVSEGVDYELESMPQCRYYRLQVANLAGSCAPMDNAKPENLRELQKLAKKFIAENGAEFDEICGVLKEGRGSNMPGLGVPGLVPRYKVT